MNNQMKFRVQAYGKTVKIDISDESDINDAMEAVASLLAAIGYSDRTVLAGMQNYVAERT
jgi:hypothetical protein